MAKDYCVYMHTCPNGKVYIGITNQTPSKRWQKGKGYRRQKYFFSAIEKYGWENIKHEILFDCIDKEKAEQTEIELIRKHRSNERDFGYNIAEGGAMHECVSEETKRRISSKIAGRQLSEETKRKIGDANKGKSHRVSEETKEKIRLAMTGRTLNAEWREKISASNKGKKHGWKIASEETKMKMRESNPTKKEVLQFTVDGKLVNSFVSIMEAERQTQISNSKICCVCNGKRKTAGGYVWRYKEVTANG